MKHNALKEVMDIEKRTRLKCAWNEFIKSYINELKSLTSSPMCHLIILL